MSKFTVNWNADAKNDLAELWMRAKKKRLVNEHAAEIDRILSQDAGSKLHRTHEGLYFLSFGPFAAAYTVDLVNRTAEVVGIGLITKST